MSRPYTEHPSYRAAREAYFSDPGRPSLLRVAQQLGVADSTVRYWAKRENWAETRNLLCGRGPSRSSRRQRRLAPGNGNETADTQGLLQELAEIRNATPERLAELLANEPMERQRRYLTLMKVLEVLAVRATTQTKPPDAERFVGAIATLFDIAHRVAGLPTTIPKKRPPERSRVRKPPRAEVRRLREMLDGEGGAVSSKAKGGIDT